MLNDLPTPLFSFNVEAYKINAIRNPPEWSIPEKNSMTTIGLLSDINDLLSAVLYFYWPNEKIPKQTSPHPVDAPLTLELHYPISAYAAIVSLLQGPGELEAYYSNVDGQVLAGVRQTKFIYR